MKILIDLMDIISLVFLGMITVGVLFLYIHIKIQFPSDKKDKKEEFKD